MIALGERLTAFIDDQPAAVMDEAPLVKLGIVAIDSPNAFDGIKVQ